LVFAATNAFAGVWTYLYCPESGNRTFEENQDFFHEAADEGSWVVSHVCDGEYTVLPAKEVEHVEEEEAVQEVGDNGEGQSGQRWKVKKQKRKRQAKLDAHEETSPLLGRSSAR